MSLGHHYPGLVTERWRMLRCSFHAHSFPYLLHSVSLRFFGRAVLERIPLLPAVAAPSGKRESSGETSPIVPSEPSQNGLDKSAPHPIEILARTPRSRDGLATLRQTYTVALVGWQVCLRRLRESINQDALQAAVEEQPPIPPEPEPRYPTRWRAAATLEELLTDNQVRRVAFAKARSLGYTDQDAEDCFQLGSINLWKALQEQPTLLCDKGAAWVGIWMAFSGSRRALWKHKARCVPLDRPYQRGSRTE
jgi:hypothetical protein